MDRRGWTLAGGALVLVALALWWRMHGDATASPASAPAAPASVPAAPAPDASNPAGDTVAATAAPDLLKALSDPPPHSPPPPPPVFPEPLPPWDAKLADVLPALKARADAGDHVAACHIGLALSACAAWMDHQPSPAELRQVSPDDKDTIDRMARLSGDMRRPGREKTCDGLPESELEQSFAYLQQSADAGNTTAMLAYAEGIPLQSFNMMFRHPEWLEAHRQRAPRYVAELIRRGDRFMAFLLSMNGDGMQMSLLGKALDMDQTTAATAWYLGREVLPRQTGDWHWGSPELRQAAQARARTIHRRYFEQRPFQSGEFKGRSDLMNVELCGSQP